jgi:hypothetical protein
MAAISQPRETAPEENEADAREPVAQPTPLAVWVYEGLVCVTVIDPPARDPHPGVCRCEACHAGLSADSAGRFY